MPDVSMASEPGFESSEAWFRAQLVDRRRRLAALPALREREDFRGLIREVDAALARLDRGSFGACERCHESIEGSRLIGDPLTRFCLDCLTDAQQRALERDLELAAAAQRALLPPEHVQAGAWEVAHRYRPLGLVSGDYCDVLRRAASDGTVHFVLGDVAGKGVAASIPMAHLQAVFRSLASADLPLADLAGRANRIFCEGVASNAYSTLLLGRLSADGLLEICNAGHCPPLLARASAVTRIDATGLPLGVFHDSTYETRCFTLEPGDSLLLYTDGLAEAVDPAGEPYGPERVEAFARRLNGRATARVLDDCLADLAAFQAGASRQDDLTLMIVRRKPCPTSTESRS
jgi:sigma-B regulation protein RsbU (phosphoserine phosphatase)